MLKEIEYKMSYSWAGLFADLFTTKLSDIRGLLKTIDKMILNKPIVQEILKAGDKVYEKRIYDKK